MPDKTFLSYEELAVAAEKRCGRAMRNSLIIAIVFAVLAVTATASLIANWSLPFWALVALAILALISILVSVVSFIDSGRFFELKYYEPRLWEKTAACEKLKQDARVYAEKTEEYYRCLLRDHLALIMFVGSRSPALLTEFTAINAEEAEEKKKEEGGSQPPPEKGEKN